MLRRIEQRIAVAARRTALGTAGLVLTLLGIGFLTVAAWIIIAALASALVAALVIGTVFVGCGLICFGLATARPRPAAPPVADPVPPPPATGWDGILQAFLAGLNAGLSRREPPPPP